MSESEALKLAMTMAEAEVVLRRRVAEAELSPDSMHSVAMRLQERAASVAWLRSIGLLDAAARIERGEHVK